ncbi:MAG: RHS repeat-associated core domain-containing protein [Candidatus Brocadiia bacterium]
MTLYITPGGRVYSPELERFLSKDRMTAPGTNPYVYARNNPLRFVDPTGLVTRDQIAEIAKQMGLTLPMDHSQDTAITKAIQGIIGVKPDGFFGPASAAAYEAWAKRNNLPVVETYKGADPVVGRHLLLRVHGIEEGTRCWDWRSFWQVYYTFYYESLDIHVAKRYWQAGAGGAPLNIIGGPLGSTRRRSTATGIAQMNDPTVRDIQRWVENSDIALETVRWLLGLKPEEPLPKNWAMTGRYDLRMSIFMAMQLLHDDLRRNGCDLDRALNRWEAWRKYRKEIDAKVQERLKNEDPFLDRILGEFGVPPIVRTPG